MSKACVHFPQIENLSLPYNATAQCDDGEIETWVKNDIANYRLALESVSGNGLSTPRPFVHRIEGKNKTNSGLNNTMAYNAAALVTLPKANSIHLMAIGCSVFVHYDHARYHIDRTDMIVGIRDSTKSAGPGNLSPP